MNENEKIIEKMKPTRGEFTIETYDLDDNLIDTYSDHNQIMARTPFNYACLTYGAGCNGFNNEWPLNPTFDDFRVGVLAVGSDGVDEDGIPKTIECNRNMLYSEQNLWAAQTAGSISGQDTDLNKYVYQTSFDTVANDSSDETKMMEAIKTTEGPSFPWDFDNNIPEFYRMVPDNSNGLEFSDTSMTVKTNHQELTLAYEFTLGQFAGNGVWELAPAFSEAALYMNYIPRDAEGSGIDGKPLGAMFSMKTFPKHFKTEACYFRIKWNLIFGTNVCPENQVPVIQLIGDAVIYVIQNTEYIDEGATAYDTEEGSLTTQIITTGLDEIDTSVLGSNTITYYVEDVAGQSASVTREVIVQVNEIPVITLVGTDITLDVGVPYIEYGAVATDQEDGIINVVIDSSAVDVNTGGVYEVTYNATDSNGGVAVEVIRTVTVIQGFGFEATITELPPT